MHGRTITVRLDGQPPRQVMVHLDTYGHIAHGYAATIHKSQGATVDRTHLFVSPNMDRHAAYVAMTRHRDRLDLHWSLDSIPARARLASILSRANLKDTTLDYAEDRAREHDARREAADSMRERVRRRAASFTEREATRHGRAANARSLLPGSATGTQIARLAFNAAERARLFRHQQTILRQWAHRVVPPPSSVTPPIARPSPAERQAARLDHDAQTIHLLHEMQDRHAAARGVEQEGRSALQRAAAANWQALTLRTSAGAFLAKWSGYLTRHWLATHPGANDNELAPAPPRSPPWQAAP